MVHVVDPNTDVLDSVRVFLRLEGLRSVAFKRLADFYRSNEYQPAELFIINFHQINGHGLYALQRMRKMHPSVPVIMLSDRVSLGQTVAAMQAGAVNVLATPINTTHLIQAIKEAFATDVGDGREGIKSRSELTPRENEVLELVVVGQTNKEVARQLGISPRTVEVHRARVMSKLGARNAAELIRLALQFPVAN